MDHQHPQAAAEQALLAAQSLESALLFEEAPNDDQDASLRLLGFCLAELGRRHKPLEPLPGASIEALLTSITAVLRCLGNYSMMSCP